ncbi:MAG: ABC transporter substrate-binding protein, partial [Spirochaetaceae bacterium]|nr:ABC transporter substrate-binding protein [Spirochaetaceae bacterium]
KFLVLAFALFAVSGLSAQNVKGTLTVWSYTDEMTNMLNNYFKPAHKDVQITYSFIPSDQFPSKLDTALASGNGTPDVFNLEMLELRKYVESGLLLDLTSIYEKHKAKLLAYPAEVGTYNGKVYALSWQAVPGAMFYRRSLAKKYLGTDDPAKVQLLFSNFNKFLETAKLLGDKSRGKCAVVSGAQDLLLPFLGTRTQSWVVNGKLVIDPVMEQYMDFCKTLRDNKWAGIVGQWSDGWFKGMQGNITDRDGKQQEVFSYFLATWGLQYVLKMNAPDTAGDWAMIQGPAPYYWGGTCIAAHKNTKNPEAALAMIEWLTANDGFLEQWAKDTGDIVSNTDVIDKVKNNYNEAYLAGQNHYAAFADIAKNVNGKLAQKDDEDIQQRFWEEVYFYIKGEKTKAQALADFRNQVRLQFGL